MKPQIIRVILCENRVFTTCKVYYESGRIRVWQWRTDCPEWETAASDEVLCVLPKTVRNFMHSENVGVQYRFHDSECGLPWRSWTYRECYPDRCLQDLPLVLRG